jgi:hypothetical protein
VGTNLLLAVDVEGALLDLEHEVDASPLGLAVDLLLVVPPKVSLVRRHLLFDQNLIRFVATSEEES